MNELEIKTLEAQFIEHKKLFLQNIFDSELSKVEKLVLIQKHNLLPVHYYLLNPFYKQEEQLEELVKPKINRDWVITDDYWRNQDIPRHQIVYFGDAVSELDDFDDWTDREDGLITVVTNRSTTDVIKVTKEEFINIIYDFVVEKQVIGFKNDW